MTVEATGRICVVIAAHNAAATIGRAVRSALQQPEVSEVLVVDDASSDGGADIAAKEQDGSGRLEIYRLPLNQGPSAARNFALERSKAPFWCVLDADDYLLPNRFAMLLKAWSDCDFLADDILFAKEDEPDQIIGRLFGDASPPPKVTLAEFASNNVSRPGKPRREFGFLKPLVRRTFIDAAHLRYDPSLRLGEDYIFYASALAAGARFELSPAGGYVAVERSSSLSGSHTTADIGAFYRACMALSDRPDLSASDRTALLRHAASLKKRLDHRMILDIRRQRGLTPAVVALLRSSSAAYILAETARAKLRS